MPAYIRTEYVMIKIRVTADDVESAEEIGNDFVDSLIFDDKTLRKRAKEINAPECYYVGAESTGDSELEICQDQNKN